MIYISHPFNNDERNKQRIEQIVLELVDRYPRETFVSPVHCFGFMYESCDYERGIEMCLELLEMCDSMLVYGDWEKSRGCNIEVEYAEKNHIPYMIMR